MIVVNIVLFVITSGVCVSNFTDIEFALHFITGLPFCKVVIKRNSVRDRVQKMTEIEQNFINVVITTDNDAKRM